MSFRLLPRHVLTALAFAVPATLAACAKAPPEPDALKADPAATTTPVAKPSASALAAEGADLAAAPAVTTPKPAKGGDPLAGVWTLADATKDIKGTGSLIAKIETNKGNLECKLLEDKAPLTVANFVGLANGTRPWRDPKSREWVKRPAYDGTTFHRIIKGFMIQGGDAMGNGTGEPGYVVKDEIWAGAKHDKPGQLCMANRGPNTNGAQFFITDQAASNLDGGYTIFGDCTPVATIHAIAAVPVDGEAPNPPVVIKSIKVARGGK